MKQFLLYRLPALLAAVLFTASAANAAVTTSGNISPSDIEPSEWCIEDRATVYIGEPLIPSDGNSIETYQAYLGYQSYST